MAKTIQIIMDLDGEQYTPELAKERNQFDLAEVARDIYTGEWPGQFTGAAILDWETGTMENVTMRVWELIRAHQRKDAA